jgi:hypothetical protein
MRPSYARRTRRILLAAALALGGTVVVDDPAQAGTAQIHGVNWADQRDNFVNGVLYVSGLGSADTYASASVVADRVVGQLYSITGANSVRMPINEPTVATYWNTYTGAIDQALTKGKVILAYWGRLHQRQPTLENRRCRMMREVHHMRTVTLGGERLRAHRIPGRLRSCPCRLSSSRTGGPGAAGTRPARQERHRRWSRRHRGPARSGMARGPEAVAGWPDAMRECWAGQASVLVTGRRRVSGRAGRWCHHAGRWHRGRCAGRGQTRHDRTGRVNGFAARRVEQRGTLRLHRQRTLRLL